MVQPDSIARRKELNAPEMTRPTVVFIIDDDICTRCALCVDRYLTGVIILGKAGPATSAGESHTRTQPGYAYGAGSDHDMAKIIDETPPTAKERVQRPSIPFRDHRCGAASSVGSIFRKGYTDSPQKPFIRVMNSVLYHLHQ